MCITHYDFSFYLVGKLDLFSFAPPNSGIIKNERYPIALYHQHD